MNKDDILSGLKGAESDLRSRGVAHAALFGSVPRDEAGPDSDIDIMVEIAPEVEKNLDLYAYLSIVHTIEDLFSTRVDVADRKQLNRSCAPAPSVMRSMPSDLRTLNALHDMRDNILLAQHFVTTMTYDTFKVSTLHFYAVTPGRRNHLRGKQASARRPA